jgi:hypothetical protein
MPRVEVLFGSIVQSSAYQRFDCRRSVVVSSLFFHWIVDVFAASTTRRFASLRGLSRVRFVGSTTYSAGSLVLS